MCELGWLGGNKRCSSVSVARRDGEGLRREAGGRARTVRTSSARRGTAATQPTWRAYPTRCTSLPHAAPCREGSTRAGRYEGGGRGRATVAVCWRRAAARRVPSRHRPRTAGIDTMQETGGGGEKKIPARDDEMQKKREEKWRHVNGACPTWRPRAAARQRSRRCRLCTAAPAWAARGGQGRAPAGRCRSHLARR